MKNVIKFDQNQWLIDFHNVVVVSFQELRYLLRNFVLNDVWPTPCFVSFFFFLLVDPEPQDGWADGPQNYPTIPTSNQSTLITDILILKPLHSENPYMAKTNSM